MKSDSLLKQLKLQVDSFKMQYHVNDAKNSHLGKSYTKMLNVKHAYIWMFTIHFKTGQKGIEQSPQVLKWKYTVHPITRFCLDISVVNWVRLIVYSSILDLLGWSQYRTKNKQCQHASSFTFPSMCLQSHVHQHGGNKHSEMPWLECL